MKRVIAQARAQFAAGRKLLLEEMRRAVLPRQSRTLRRRRSIAS
jgi:hypothetical protein